MTGKIAIAVLLAGVLAAVGLAALRGDEAADEPRYTTLASVRPDLAGADPRLKKIYAQAGDLLPGGLPAYDRRIESLRGLPVIVNKWGSWCPPCRREFPAFQGAAKATGNKVAFLGANVQDSSSDAKKFLAEYPVPYPSYVDEKLKIAKLLKPAQGAPVTGFYDTEGKLIYTHAGPYHSAAALKADIKKYLSVQ